MTSDLATDRQFFFAADLHGSEARYRTLLSLILEEQPGAVFLGGDLLPSHLAHLDGSSLPPAEFVERRLIPGFREVRGALGDRYPRVFLILGNDDPRSAEEAVRSGEELGLWRYLHGRRGEVAGHPVYGYSCIPPSPFRLKDWERYDVSRFVDPGCIPPTDGWRTVPVDEREILHGTIRGDLEALTGEDDLSRAILLFHAPPHRTVLDRAALDGVQVDHAPLDVHIGSVAVREFIERRQPLVTLHGHVHEAARITGRWRERLGRTEMFGAAHEGPELALVRFSPERLAGADRRLL